MSTIQAMTSAAPTPIMNPAATSDCIQKRAATPEYNSFSIGKLACAIGS
jgi:hypothetical protein